MKLSKEAMDILMPYCRKTKQRPVDVVNDIIINNRLMKGNNNEQSAEDKRS